MGDDTQGTQEAKPALEAPLATRWGNRVANEGIAGVGNGCSMIVAF